MKPKPTKCSKHGVVHTNGGYPSCTKKKVVKVTKDVSYDRLKCLIVASYLLGQETGLRGMTYSHPIAKEQRENLTSFIFNAKI